MKTLVVLAAVTLIFCVIVFQKGENSAAAARFVPRDSGRFENYDIRYDASPATVDRLSTMRGGELHRASTTDPRFKTESNDALGLVEVVDRKTLDAEFLALRNGRSRARTLTDFVSENRHLFGSIPADQLHKIADYTNPDGNLSYAHFTQEIDGIPVFGAELKAGFTRNGEMFRLVNSLAADVSNSRIATDFGSSQSAIISAASHLGLLIHADALTARPALKQNQFRYSNPAFDEELSAERFYFPIGNGVVQPSWRVMLASGGKSYYVVVDAADGTLLWRKSLTEEQALSATYNVYGNTTSFVKTADSPSPFSPGCNAPTGCAQPPAVARMNFTLIGNEVPYAFNNLGWIPDTGLPVRTPANNNITDGNNVEAGIDRVAPTGIDENGWAVGSPTRVFSYTYNPAPGIPPPGEEPIPPGPQPTPPTAFQQGVITQAFYTINRWHDEMYRLGFNELAGNFQHFNFGRGGSEGDRISMEVQDFSATNAANFTVAADGGRPRLQMFLWTGGTPDRDGALDAQVVLHEATHGLSLRLHGNASGLSSNMARGMGEGWSDFYALALLSEPADNRLGTHAVGGYVTYQIFPGYEANYYYGIRRFPLAVWASVGPNGLPHNPLTFRYINAGCNTLIGTDVTNPNSAYPRGPIGATSQCDQIHNLGEVWAVTLWEVRDQLIERNGADGNRRILQYATDGMKLSPLNPTVVNSRDAILAAAAATDPNDLGPMYRGFAIRGLGIGASIQNPGSGTNNTVVTENFDIPLQFRRPTRADFDGDRKSDISVFRPSDRIWYLNRSSDGFAAINWGLATDELVPDDFDGDGKTDLGIFRASADGATPDFYILHSGTFTVSYVSWGTTGDVAVSEDFDGDNKADHAVYRSSSSTFWIRRSLDGSVLAIGPLAGTPIVGDWDGDGRGDVGSFNNGTWRLTRSGTTYATSIVVGWGMAGDRAVHGDYDGDGRDDFAVYRPSNGTWYIANSSGGARSVHFGISTDTPVPADYDGDGRTDIAVYRNGVWYVNGSTSGVMISSFGLAGDMPLAASYIP